MMRNRKATGRAVAFLLQCRAAEEKSAACFLALHGKLGNETERNLTRVKKKWLSLYP